MIVLFPVKAQFREGEPISFHIENCVDETVNLQIFSVGKPVFNKTIEIKEGIIELPEFEARRGGYLVEVTSSDKVVVQTAFDVDSDMIRYGFLSDFFQGGENENQSIRWMNKLHLNYIQYYDWMYRHDDLIPQTEIFEDLLGRKLSSNTIQSRIKQAREAGMVNIAYGAIYGGTNDFAAANPDWRMYDKNGQPIGFFDFLSIMNVNKESGWHDHIINEYKKAVEYGFDGIHMDTYGFPKEARNVKGEILDLPEDFGQLIDDSKAVLKEVNEDVKLIFNNVGNWPVYSVANRDQEAIYIEVWDPYSTYQGIEEIITNARRENKEKQIILAAYLKPFEYEVTEKTYNSLWLLTAIITILGASHLIHGENGGIITEGYYAKYFHVEESSKKEQIRRYYDYITFLAEFWRNNALSDASRTHFLGDNREYVSDCEYLTPNLEAGKIWMNIRQNDKIKFINFVNLTGAQDTIWNHQKDIQESDVFSLKILMNREIKAVTYLTPDGDVIKFDSLAYNIEESEFGPYLVVEIPRLLVWGTLIIEMD